jgi:hypothetical protein
LGGVTTVIDNIDITVDAKANTINNSNVTGNLLCKNGSGNNKACNTSFVEPSPEALPISDPLVDQWKGEATAGGTISGNYTPTGTSSNLGPVEITGNLTIPGGHTLTLQGTVYVRGTITTGIGAIIRLDPGYGGAGGVMVADGYVLLENNNQFQGSGQSSSYILLMTTNDCNGTASPTGMTCTTGNSAMWVSNNVGAVVLYTSRGQLGINNNAGAKEATGYRVFLSQNATVTYDSGLASSEFSSGPGGGYEIVSWKEIE